MSHPENVDDNAAPGAFPLVYTPERTLRTRQIIARGPSTRRRLPRKTMTSLRLSRPVVPMTVAPSLPSVMPCLDDKIGTSAERVVPRTTSSMLTLALPADSVTSVSGGRNFAEDNGDLISILNSALRIVQSSPLQSCSPTSVLDLKISSPYFASRTPCPLPRASLMPMRRVVSEDDEDDRDARYGDDDEEDRSRFDELDLPPGIFLPEL